MITSFSEEQKTFRREVSLLKAIGIPGFGEGKCHNVLAAFGTLHIMSRAPAIIVFGIKSLTKPSQETLYEALCDDSIRQTIKDQALTKDAQVELPGLVMGEFVAKPVLEKMVGFRLRGRASETILDRWSSGASLKDSLMKEHLWGRLIHQETHFDLMRAMNPLSQKQLADSLDPYRGIFRHS